MSQGNGRFKEKIISVLSHLNLVVDFLRQIKNSFLGKYSIRGILVEVLCIILAMIDKKFDKKYENFKLAKQKRKLKIAEYDKKDIFKIRARFNEHVRQKAQEILDAERGKIK